MLQGNRTMWSYKKIEIHTIVKSRCSLFLYLVFHVSKCSLNLHPKFDVRTLIFHVWTLPVRDSRALQSPHRICIRFPSFAKRNREKLTRDKDLIRWAYTNPPPTPDMQSLKWLCVESFNNLVHPWKVYGYVLNHSQMAQNVFKYPPNIQWKIRALGRLRGTEGGLDSFGPRPFGSMFPATMAEDHHQGPGDRPNTAYTGP